MNAVSNFLDFSKSPTLKFTNKAGEFVKKNAGKAVLGTALAATTLMPSIDLNTDLHAAEPGKTAANNIKIDEAKTWSPQVHKEAMENIGLNPNNEKDKVIFQFVERGLVKYNRADVQAFKKHTRSMDAYKQKGKYTDLHGILKGLDNVSGKNVPDDIKMQPGDERLFVNSPDPLLARQILSSWGGGKDKNNPGQRTHALTRDEALTLIDKVNNNQYRDVEGFARELMNTEIASLKRRQVSSYESSMKNKESTIGYIKKDIKFSLLASR